MSKRMRIAVVSARHASEEVHEWLDEPRALANAPQYVANHSACSCPLGIARALTHLGGFDARMWIDGPVDADAAIFSEWNFMEWIHRAGFWDFGKPSIMYLHSDFPGKLFDGHGLQATFAGICFTRQEALDIFRAKWGDANYWVAPWGIPDWWIMPPMRRNPYEPGTRNAIYAGRLEKGSWLTSRILAVAEAFPNLAVWVVSESAAAAEDLRLDAHPNVRFLGPKCHGTFLHHLYYADLALDSGIVPSKLANNCKLWDYLGCGVPVVIDGETGGIELLRETGHGRIVSKGDVPAYLRAVSELLACPPSPSARSGVIRHMQERHSWMATTATWIDRLKTAIGG